MRLIKPLLDKSYHFYYYSDEGCFCLVAWSVVGCVVCGCVIYCWLRGIVVGCMVYVWMHGPRLRGLWLAAWSVVVWSMVGCMDCGWLLGLCGVIYDWLRAPCLYGLWFDVWLWLLGLWLAAWSVLVWSMVSCVVCGCVVYGLPCGLWLSGQRLAL